MKIHFVGIGGIGMSSIALHFFRSGKKISGSNISENERVMYLRKLGINVKIGHDPSYLPDDTTLVIRTRAVRDDNPEILEAQKFKIPIMERNEVLIDIVKKLTPSIGVTGTDGKTTTTAMVFHVLKKLGENPYGFLGGIHKSFEDGNYSRGSNGVVFELDESVPVFAEYEVTHLIVTNARADHLENFNNDIEFYKNSFHKLAKRAKGIVATYHDDELTSSFGKVTFGIGGGDFTLIERVVTGKEQYFVYRNPKGRYVKVFLKVPGFHNCLNALAVVALLTTIGFEEDNVVNALKDFESVHRRFSVTFADSERDIYVIDDYAHTPEEISSLLNTAKEVFKNKKIIAFFQPHRYSRTLRENGRFSEVLSKADVVYVTDIYGAFERDINVRAQDIARKINERGGKAFYIPDLDEFMEDFGAIENSVYIFIGAGDIIEHSKRFSTMLKVGSKSR